MTVKLYRITCGSIVLLIVDLVWVLSSELTEYLYEDKKYKKPFFSTYVKTSLFTVYLLGFILCKSWRQQCYQLIRSVRLTDAADIHLSANGGQTAGQQSSSSAGRSMPMYSVLDQSSEQLDDVVEDIDNPFDAKTDRKENPEWEQVLSDPVWIPIKFSTSCDTSCVNSEKSSGTESDSERCHKLSHTPRRTNGHQKSVRFSKLTEVRQLSESQAEEALLARLSYQATLKAKEQQLCQNRQQNANKLSVGQTVRLSLLFSTLWFVANWSYQLALRYSEAGLVNLLSSMSSLFTILLSPIFPSNSSSDNFSLTKLVAVVVSVASIAVITTATTQSATKSADYMPIGTLWSLSGAFFYAAYVVLLRYKVSNEDVIDIPMFFGFVGLFNLIALWPLFFILHYTGIEVFQWPNAEQWAIILVNGLIGTVLSEFLWLWGCFLTSSLLASLSVSLTIPLTTLFDVVLKDVSYPRLFFVGAIPLYVSFFCITLLSHYDNWDPLASLLIKLVRQSVLRKPIVRASDPLYGEQSQSLITDGTAA